jgi:hypothetical protein
LPTVFEPLRKEDGGKLQFGTTPLRDIVKTPDEVADLPMHEVVDYQGYVEYGGKKVEKQEEIATKISEVSKTIEVIETKKEEDKTETIKEIVQTIEIQEEKTTELNQEIITESKEEIIKIVEVSSIEKSTEKSPEEKVKEAIALQEKIDQISTEVKGKFLKAFSVRISENTALEGD